MPESKEPDDGGDAEKRALGTFLKIVIPAGLAVLALWWLAIYEPARLLPAGQSLDARGNAVGALFSGLAFVGVVAAIILQWRELGLQRLELRETKNAMQQSANAQTMQTTELQAQTVLLRSQTEAMKETSTYQQFFELVRFLNEQRESRGAIFALMANKILCSKWQYVDKQRAEQVCTGFNLAGILAKRGGLLEDLIIDAYRRSAVTLRDGLDVLLFEIRGDRGQQYCKEFDWLVDQMRRREKSGT
jgi:hypothetical protein